MAFESLTLPPNPLSNAFSTQVFFGDWERYLVLERRKRLKESLQVIENYMNDAITSHKESPSDDLLSRFMNKRDVNDKPFSMSVLQRIALNFVLAGRNMLSVALSWFFWLVMHYPEVEDKIVKEISTILNDTRGADHRKWVQEPLVFYEANRLVYQKAALAETLRLFPSVPEDFKYVVSNDVLLDGTFVLARSTMTYSIYSVGRMKSIWGEDYIEFKSDRWLSADGDWFELPNDGYKFVAFNDGHRTCLGNDLAYLQMKYVTSTMLLRYRLLPDLGHRVKQKMSLMLFMKNGLQVYLNPR